MKKTTFLLLLFLNFNFLHSQSIATYNITFTSIWNSPDHGALPSGAHWSKLVGANHNSSVSFLEVGGLATTGIKDIAERGVNFDFETVDVQNAINAGNAQQYINGNALGTATGAITYNGLQVKEQFPLLTLVSMIAPSPDWMIAAKNIDLRSGNNAINNGWKSSVTVNLFAYDAGTDNGANYVTANSPTNPAQPISMITGFPFNGNLIGTITINYVSSVLSLNENTIENVSVFPNPAKSKITISNITNVDLSSIEIYNVLGKKVKQLNTKTNLNEIQINIEALNTGLYLLKMIAKNGTSKTQKLIVQ